MGISYMPQTPPVDDSRIWIWALPECSAERERKQQHVNIWHIMTASGYSSIAVVWRGFTPVHLGVTDEQCKEKAAVIVCLNIWRNRGAWCLWGIYHITCAVMRAVV